MEENYYRWYIFLVIECKKGGNNPSISPSHSHINTEMCTYADRDIYFLEQAMIIRKYLAKVNCMGAIEFYSRGKYTHRWTSENEVWMLDAIKQTQNGINVNWIGGCRRGGGGPSCIGMLVTYWQNIWIRSITDMSFKVQPTGTLEVSVIQMSVCNQKTYERKSFTEGPASASSNRSTVYVGTDAQISNKNNKKMK